MKEPMIFSKETIENLLGYEIENFSYETTRDMEGKVVKYDLFVHPKMKIEHIHVDFTLTKDNGFETEVK